MRIATNLERSGRLGRSQRRGVIVAAELVLVMPILLIFLLAIVEFYLLVGTRVEMLNAARVGARVAASGGYANKAAVNDEVGKSVHRALGHGRLTRASTVHVTWSQDLPAKDTAGEADWVAVEVEVPAQRVIPELLGWAGFAFGKRKLVVATIMKQE